MSKKGVKVQYKRTNDILTYKFQLLFKLPEFWYKSILASADSVPSLSVLDKEILESFKIGYEAKPKNRKFLMSVVKDAKHQRIAKDWLSHHSGLSKNYILQILKGKANLTVDAIDQLGDACGIPTYILLAPDHDFLRYIDSRIDIRLIIESFEEPLHFVSAQMR